MQPTLFSILLNWPKVSGNFNKHLGTFSFINWKLHCVDDLLYWQ